MKNSRPADIKEIAASLGLSVKTIRRYHAKGMIKTYQLGGPHCPIRMARTDLKKLLKKGRR